MANCFGACTPANRRTLHRGGGPNNEDYLNTITAGENCTEICWYGMIWGSMYTYWYNLPNYDTNSYGGAHPYYLKCYEASAASPLNNRRLQYASQLSTNEIDPSLPEMKPWNGTGDGWKACLSKNCIFFF